MLRIVRAELNYKSLVDFKRFPLKFDFNRHENIQKIEVEEMITFDGNLENNFVINFFT
jgi:hypothetical protein